MKKTTYIMFRNDGEVDQVPQGQRWYFLIDPEIYQVTLLIKVDDCGEGTHRAQEWMKANGIAWRRFGEKAKDKKVIEEWWTIHHRSLKPSKRSDELMTSIARGNVLTLPETIFDVIVNETGITKVVDLLM